MKTRFCIVLRLLSVGALHYITIANPGRLLAQNTPPAVTAQPASKAISRGTTVSFYVGVSGSNPLSVQWRLNQADLPAGTTSLLTLTNVQFDQAGEYQAVISNSWGSVTSGVARLSVSPEFLKVTTGPVATSFGGTGGAWGDFNNDGLLDLFVAIGNGTASLLFTNAGNNTLVRDTTAGIGAGTGSSWGCAWGDFDNDGFLDLFVTRVNQPNLLYHNNRDGTFTKMSAAPFSTDIAISQGCSWGDYDNDGLLDLIVCNNNAANFLYHNDGNGHFSKVAAGAFPGGTSPCSGSAWVDYDNDGFLDLFIAVRGGSNLLFHNNGDGTFTSVTSGTVVSDSGTWIGAAWGDVNNDGFPDLFVGNYSGNNGLYINGGNSNNWLGVTCAGRISNRAGIGAKVRVKATIGNRPMWQMREISGGGGLASQNDLRAQFGLGDATNVDIVRVEWPSGAVQEMRNVAPRQYLTIREPSRLQAEYLTESGQLQVRVTGGRGLAYSVEKSMDLANWISIGVITNQTGTITLTNPQSFSSPATPTFFRADEH